jgi:GT2 family glycosyltransferase
MDISIIIVNWNTRDLLEQCLKSIKDSVSKDIRYEVIVVDNGSSDGSAEMIRDIFPSVQIIKNNANYGYVYANNQGASVSKGRYLLLLNSDTLVLDDGIKRVISYLDTYPDVGVATGRVLNPDGTFQRPFRRFPHLLGGIYRHTVNLVKLVNHPFEKRYRLENLDEFYEHEVDWVTGAYLFLRRELMEGGKVFDEAIYMYYEDTLLCARARKNGYRIMYLPFAPIIHYHQASARLIGSQAIFYSFRSSVIYFKKIYGKFVAKLYSSITRIIWCAFALIFSLLQIFPLRKFKEKAELFRSLLSEGCVL